MATKLTNAVASSLANAIQTAIGSNGKIVIYNGTGGEPATADTAITTQGVLATFTVTGAMFGSASNGVISLVTTPATVAASASGTAAFFRITTSTNTVILQGTVGTSGQQLNLNTTTITSGVNVSITSGTVTVPTT